MTARSWVRRSRWALIGLAVALPAAVLATLSIDWIDYTRLTTSDPVRVAEGDTGTFSGVEVTLVDHRLIEAESVEGRDLGAVAGTTIVIARVHVDSSGVEPGTSSCTMLLVAPGGGGDRVWDTGQTEVFVPDDDDTVGYCAFPDPDDPADDDPAEYDLQAVFVVPSDVADEVVLRVSDGPFAQRQVLQLDW